MPATQYTGFTDAEAVNNSKQSTFIYKDLNLYFTRNPVTSDVSTVTDVQDIKRAVRHIVLLNPGEKPFHPEIGTGVRGALFTNFTPTYFFIVIQTFLQYKLPPLDLLYNPPEIREDMSEEILNDKAKELVKPAKEPGHGVFQYD